MAMERWLRLALVLASTALTACSGLLFGAANAPTYFGSQQRAHDVSHGSAPRQQLDVYAPAAARRLPIAVLWHGGSWAGGDKSQSVRFIESVTSGADVTAARRP